MLVVCALLFIIPCMLVFRHQHQLQPHQLALHSRQRMIATPVLGGYIWGKHGARGRGIVGLMCCCLAAVVDRWWLVVLGDYWVVSVIT